MSFNNTDRYALAGYEYAIGKGRLVSIEFNNEIDLMAFNSGISQANDRHDLNITKFHLIGTVLLSNRQQATDKEIQTGVYCG